MPNHFYKSAEKPLPLWKQNLKRAVQAIQTWFRKLITSVLEIIVLFFATAVMSGILLSFIEAFWYLYLQAPVGIKYTADPTRSSVHLVTQIIDQDLFLFSVDMAIAAMIASLLVSAACQILAVHRYFYEGHGLLNRGIWLALFSAATAYILARNSQMDVQVAFGIAIAPSLYLFSSCLNIEKRLSPELTPFAIIEMFTSLKNAWVQPADRIRSKARTSVYPMDAADLHPSIAQPPQPAPKPHRSKNLKPNTSGTAPGPPL